MVKKEFTFKGKKLQELQAMSTEEFAEILNSRGRRSLKRRTNKNLEKSIEAAKKLVAENKEQKPIRTHSRDAIVVPGMIGLTFAIYNGKEFIQVKIYPEMLGHYFGEFALTRKKLSHGKAGIGATKSSTAIVTARG